MKKKRNFRKGRAQVLKMHTQSIPQDEKYLGKFHTFYIPRPEEYFSEPFSKEDPSRTEGETSDGICRIFHNNGKIKYRGEFRRGLRKGVWKEFFKYGTLRGETVFDQGRCTYWIQYNTNQTIYYKTEVRNGKPNGLCTIYFSDQTFWGTGNVRNGKKEGEWTIFKRSGEIKAKVSFSNGKRVLWKCFSDEGTIESEIEIKDDSRFGICKEYFPNGNIKMEEKNEDNVMHWKIYDENGQLKDIIRRTFVSRISVWKHFYESGNLKSEGRFHSLLPIGVWCSFSEDGKLIEKNSWLSGGRKTFVAFYENGNKKHQKLFIDDKPRGVWKFFHENGKIKREGPFVKDENCQFWKIYNEDGTLEKKEILHNRKREDFERTYPSRKRSPSEEGPQTLFSNLNS